MDPPLKTANPFSAKGDQVQSGRNFRNTAHTNGNNAFPPVISPKQYLAGGSIVPHISSHGAGVKTSDRDMARIKYREAELMSASQGRFDSKFSSLPAASVMLESSQKSTQQNFFPS